MRLSGHVGFDSLPDQLVNKCVNKGFDFNILCIGKHIATHHTVPVPHLGSQFDSDALEHGVCIYLWWLELDYLYKWLYLFVGETGCGKSTLMDSLFKTAFNGELSTKLLLILLNTLLHLTHN